MVEVRNKKVVAALGAVYRYVREQEELQLAMAAAEQQPRTPAGAAVSFWAASGRQATMEMRRLLQLRFMR
jgi:NADPH-dependent ferric siderophore reductase